MAACVRADEGAEGTSVEHVLDDWHEIDLQEEAVLVLGPDGDVAGYADVVNRASVSVTVYGYVHPEYRGLGIGAWLVGWGEDWGRGRMHLAPEEARVVVKHYVISTNTGARGLLQSAGYKAVRGTYVMEIYLEGEPPEPEWPEGLAVRTFVPGRDERAPSSRRSRMPSGTCGTGPGGTYERFVAMTLNENFDPSLWFLATEGEEIAGAALCKTVAGEGWVDVVGVRRPWRRRGLGLALLRHAFGEYRRRGVRRVELSVDAGSVSGAPRLYGRAGMRQMTVYVVYQRELRSGGDSPPG